MRGIKFIVVLVVLNVIIWTWALNAKADTTTIKYDGQPVPSAMAPSMSAFSQDVCAVPVAGLSLIHI